MNPELEKHPDYYALKRAIDRLSTKSHAPIQGYDFAPSDIGRGDRWRKSDRRDPIPHLGQHQSKSGDTSIPRGDIDRMGDRTPEYRQKSHMYFVLRVPRLETFSQLAALLREAEDAIEAWERTPMVAGQRPAKDDPRWKQWVASSSLNGGEIARLYGVTRQYVHQIRKGYRDAA